MSGHGKLEWVASGWDGRASSLKLWPTAEAIARRYVSDHGFTVQDYIVLRYAFCLLQKSKKQLIITIKLYSVQNE